jgi:hypothetical protein
VHAASPLPVLTSVVMSWSVCPGVVISRTDPDSPNPSAGWPIVEPGPFEQRRVQRVVGVVVAEQSQAHLVITRVGGCRGKPRHQPRTVKEQGWIS